MKPTLDPEDALGGPLYLLAAMLVIVPFVDFFTSVAKPEFGSAEWRFNTLGLLSGHVVMPVLGLAIALVVSAIQKRHDLQRGLVITCLTIAGLFVAATAMFLSEWRDIRVTITPDEMPAFSGAANRAIVRLVLASVAASYLGWRARRMIPARVHHKTPKPVHVISK